jgi:hypothetical protein
MTEQLSENTGPTNHFNYFSEVEDEFVRRRGKHCLVSPLDWTLMQTWQEAGIPLQVVLRGINQAFDNREAKQKTGTVNSISYCLQAVEKAYAAYRETQIGAHSSSEETTGNAESDQFSKQNVSAYLNNRYFALGKAQEHTADSQKLDSAIFAALLTLHDLINQVDISTTIDFDTLEASLTAIEDTILKVIESITTPEQLAAITADGKAQLQAYQSKMSPETYQQSLNTFVVKSLRGIHSIPRLSLFYMV